jgi:hypothetical protein
LAAGIGSPITIVALHRFEERVARHREKHARQAIAGCSDPSNASARGMVVRPKPTQARNASPVLPHGAPRRGTGEGEGGAIRPSAPLRPALLRLSGEATSPASSAC